MNLIFNLKNKKLFDIANTLKKKTKTTYYRIIREKSSDLSIFDSKFGGIPYWDFKEDYPKNERGENLFLLAQINFEKESFDDDRLPDKGILQFYISDDDFYGMDPRGDESDVQKNFRVVYHENINPNITESSIREKGIKSMDEIDEEMPINGTYKLLFKKSTGGIDSTEDYMFSSEVSNIIKEKYHENVKEEEVIAYLRNLNEDYYDIFEVLEDATGNHRLLGYPLFVQEDPRKYYKEKYGRYDTLLLQIDSEGDDMWGDGGIAGFFINEKDLKNKDFSKVLYDWEGM